MDSNFPGPTETTVYCLLCYKEVPCTDMKKRRYFNHLQTEHNAFYNFNVLFKINRLDVNVISIIEGKAVIDADLKPDVNNLPPPNTIFCILCRGVVPQPQVFKHLQEHHNAQFNLSVMQKVNCLNGSVLEALDQHSNVGMDQVKTQVQENDGIVQVQTQVSFNSDVPENAQTAPAIKPETTRDTTYTGMHPSLYGNTSPLPYLPNTTQLRPYSFPNSLYPTSKSALYKSRGETRPDPHDDKLQIQFITTNPETASKMSLEDWCALDKTQLKKTDYKNISMGHPLLAQAPEDLKKKIILENPSRSVKWTQSQRNYTQLCLDDFILKKNRGPYFLPSKKGRVISWKCIVQYCPYITMNVEGRLVAENKPHNHPANPQYFQKRESRQRLREAVKQINGPVNALVLGVMRQADPGMISAVGSVTALKQAARRYKHVQARKQA